MNRIRIFYSENKISGTPLLFIHGWLGGSLEWIYQISYFNMKRHIIVIDLPGYGKSDKPNVQYSLEFLTKTVMEFLELLGHDEVILIGHSLGGLIAQNITIKKPKLVKKLILISSSAVSQSIKKKILLFWVNIFFKLGYSSFLKNTIKRINSVTEENRKVRQQYRKALRIPKPVVLSTFYHMTYKLSIIESASEISQPTLIVYGTEDRIISKSNIISLD
ncbi:MAG: alpha/beta fold hydrolase, partial [Promethearchaeota archaeon]